MRRRLLLAATLLLVACAPTAAPPTSPAAPPALAPSSPPAAPGVAGSPVASPKPVASPASAGPLAKVVTSWNSASGDQVPLWVAKEAGLFQKHGLDVDVQYIASSSSMAALLAGQTQLAHVGGSEVLSAVAGGADLVVLAVPGPVYPYGFWVAPSIASAGDLKGKKVGITTPGSSIDTATRVGLPKLGLAPDEDVAIVQTGSVSNLTAALVSGAVDAAMSHPPDTLVLEPKGYHQILDLASLKLPFANNVVAAQRSWVTANRDAAQRYVDALVEAIAREKGDEAFTVGVMKQYLQSDDQKAMEATWTYYSTSVRPALPAPSANQFADSVAELGKKNDKIKSVDVGKILDPSFVQSAADRGLGGR